MSAPMVQAQEPRQGVGNFVGLPITLGLYEPTQYYKHLLPHRSAPECLQIFFSG